MEKKYWTGIIGQNRLKQFFDSLIESHSIPQAILIKGSGGNGKDAVGVRLGLILHALKKGNDLNTVSSIPNPFSQTYIKFIYALPRGKNEASFDNPYEKLSKDQMDSVLKELKLKNTNPYYKMNIEDANEIKINSIRDISRFLNISFDQDAHRTILISQAELMNEESQNSLLKNLEEPPENTTFILVSDVPEKLRETIVSRCWQLQTEPLSETEIQEILEKYFHIEPFHAEIAAAFAQGSIHNAIDLIDRDLANLKNLTVDFMRFAIGNKINSAHMILQDVQERNDPGSYTLFLRLIIIWLSDAARYTYQEENIYFKDFLETFRRFHERNQIVALDYYINKIERYIYAIENNNVNVNVVSNNLIQLLASMIRPKRR
jgi:DNA polymerase III subunit delta'